jgi:hypothetical protein
MVEPLGVRGSQRGLRNAQFIWSSVTFPAFHNTTTTTALLCFTIFLARNPKAKSGNMVSVFRGNAEQILWGYPHRKAGSELGNSETGIG